MKAIFDTRAGSGYDDDIVRRYHFPNRSLPRRSGLWVTGSSIRSHAVVGAASAMSRLHVS